MIQSTRKNVAQVKNLIKTRLSRLNTFLFKARCSPAHIYNRCALYFEVLMAIRILHLHINLELNRANNYVNLGKSILANSPE